MVRELSGQLVEHLILAALAQQIVHRLGQAEAEEVSPNAVGAGAGEILVVGRGRPLGQAIAPAGRLS